MARLFVAIEIPSEVKDQLSGSWAHPGLRRTSTENMHLTLAFLGESDPTAISASLSSVERIGTPLALRLTSWGAFPRIRSARVLWVGVDGGPELLRLVASIRGTCAPVAPLMDLKGFTTHVTLARSSSPTDLSGLEVDVPEGGWLAESYSLIESKIARPSAIYRTVQTFQV